MIFNSLWVKDIAVVEGIDYIIRNTNNKRSKRYRSYCITCKVDKGFIRKNRLNKECHSCNSKRQAEVGRTHNGKREEVIKNNKELRKNQIIIISEETKQKISISNRETWKKKNAKTRKPWNLGLSSRSQDQKRLRKNFSSLIGSRLRRRLSTKKGNSTFDVLQYSLQELMTHLESQFQPGMSWENYGQWHIDHIKPDCAFQYSSIFDDDFKKCWALSNLQPLWAKDNLSKGAKYVTV